MPASTKGLLSASAYVFRGIGFQINFPVGNWNGFQNCIQLIVIGRLRHFDGVCLRTLNHSTHSTSRCWADALRDQPTAILL
jgi:hypothetical protein